MKLTLDEIRTIIQEQREYATNNAVCYCGDYVNRHYCDDHTAVPVSDEECYDMRLLLAAEQLLAEVERLKRPSLWERFISWLDSLE